MHKKIVSLVALLVSLVVMGGALAYAQEAGVAGGSADTKVAATGITFPVQELGSCASKDECKTYCNDPVHTDACVVFAQAHGLMSKDEAAQAKKFTQGIAKGGPGGCTTPQACESFCSDVKNLEVCMSFAKKQGIKNDQVTQGEKLLTYIKSGGQTPGGCTSEADCRGYCGDFSHAEECFNFAKKAGIAQGGGGPRGSGSPRQGGPSGGGEGDMPSPEQFQKFVELAKQGQTPGGCTNKDQCESYCQNSAHFEECTAFGEKVGFISHDEAAKIRQTGGKGPGGCDSAQACQTYCNDQSHREECFKFGEEHGFISKEDSRRAQEGFVQARAGLEQAPPEVVACVKSTVGENVITDIQSGKLAPGTDVGEQIKNCFEKFGQRGGPRDMFKNAPPQVMSCVKEKLGDKFDAISSGKEMPTPEMGDALRVCFQSAQLSQQFGDDGAQGKPGQQGPGMVGGHPPAQALQQFLRSAPEGVSACLKEKLGDNFGKIQSGGAVEGFDPSVMKSCFEQFRPDSPGMQRGEPGQGEQSGERMGPPGNGQGFGQGGIPHEILSCVKEKVGGDVTEEKLRAATGDQGNLGQAIRECFGKMRPPGQGDKSNMPSEQLRPQSGPGGGGPGLPENVLSCVKEKLGDAADIQSLRRGGQPKPEVQKVIEQCFPQKPQEGERRGDEKGFQPPFPRQGFASGTGPAQPFNNRPGEGMMKGQPFSGQDGKGISPEQYKQYEGQMREQAQKQTERQIQGQIEGQVREEIIKREMQKGGTFNPFGGGQGGGQGQPNPPVGGPTGSEGGKFMGGSGPGGGFGGPGPQEHFGPGQNQPFQPQPGSGQGGGQFNQQQFGPPPSGGSGSGTGGGFGGPQPGPGGFQPPQGGFPGGFPPPPSGGGGAGSPPPPLNGAGGGGTPPPPPSSAAPRPSLLGVILSPFLNLIGR